MAEEVEIGNVGGNGVASEVTLQRLISVTEAMAKKAGIDPKDVNKKLTALSKATGDNIVVSTKNRDAIKTNSKAVTASTNALKKLSSVAGGALLGAFASVARSGTEMAKAFVAGEKSLTAFAGQLPLIGGKLGILTGLFDESFAAFQNVATSGAAFNNSLVELRNSAATARLGLDEFVGFISANTDKLAAFGGTATQGAKMVARMTASNRDMVDSMLNMGFTFEEINEAMLDFQYLTRAGNRGKRLEGEELKRTAAVAGDYAKHLTTLAKLSGKEAKAAEAEIQQKLQQVAFQRKLATMGAEEQAKVNMAMQQAQAAGGKAAVDALAAEFLGMPPVTEEARLYTATMGTQMGILTNSLNTAQDKAISVSDMSTKILTDNVALMEANKNSADEFGVLLDAAAVGVEGQLGTIAGFFNDASLKYTDYLTTTGDLDKARALQAAKDAQAEADKRADSTQTMAEFTASLATLQAAFQTEVVTPLMEAIGPSLRKIAEMIGPDKDEDGNAIEGTGIARHFKTIGDLLRDSVGPSILKFIEDFEKAEDPMVFIKEFFKDAISGIGVLLGDLIKDVFLGPNTKMINTPDGEKEVEIDREGGLLYQAKDALVEGVTEWWSETSLFTKAMVIGAGVLFAGGGPLALAMTVGASKMMARAATKLVMPRTPTSPGTGATVGRDPKTGRFTSLNNAPDTGGSRLGRFGRMLGRGAKFIPGVGLIAAGAMGAFDAATGFNADPNAGFLESAGNAGSSVLNGLTFGLLGSSSAEIAAEAANGGNANGSPETSNLTPPAPVATTTPVAGAEAAAMLTEDQVNRMERVAAISFDEFNTSMSRLNPNKLSRISGIDFTDFATGLKTFAEIPNLQTQLNAVNTLDTSGIRSYTEAMDALVETLSNLNEELSKDNDTLFTSRADAGELLNGISMSTSGTNQSSQQLNSTMQQVLAVLSDIKDFEERTANNTKNIQSSNLARGGVSNVGQ